MPEREEWRRWRWSCLRGLGQEEDRGSTGCSGCGGVVEHQGEVEEGMRKKGELRRRRVGGLGSVEVRGRPQRRRGGCEAEGN